MTKHLSVQGKQNARKGFIVSSVQEKREPLLLAHLALKKLSKT
jgi:hypothetical protein